MVDIRSMSKFNLLEVSTDSQQRNKNNKKEEESIVCTYSIRYMCVLFNIFVIRGQIPL